MADGTEEFIRAATRLLAELIREATRLAIELAERRAERLRLAAQHNERVARAERTRLAGHRAADAAIWRRTADPVWWRKATPEQLARAWRATSTWHQVDPEAAGARQVMAERLRTRGVHVDTDLAANPGDARWLQAALNLAMAERDELAALAAEHDGDIAELVSELMWDLDELPRTTVASPEASPAAAATTEPPLSADEVLWALDELTADELARRAASPPVEPGPASPPPASPRSARSPQDVVEGELVTDERPAADGVRRPDATPPEPVDSDAAPTEPGSAGPTREAPPTDEPSTGAVDMGAVAPVPVDTSAAAVVDSNSPANPSADRESWPTTAVTDGRLAPDGAAAPAADESGTHLSDVDTQRMEQVLRTAWPADRAGRVVEDPSWPALASTMHGLERAGKDVPKLLRDLPIDTTDVKLPATLAAWTLRAAARGPASLARAVRQRERSLQRFHTARQAAERHPVGRARDAENLAADPARTAEESVAALLTAAFPTTTKDALNRSAARAGEPEPARDRTDSREPVAAEL